MRDEEDGRREGRKASPRGTEQTNVRIKNEDHDKRKEKNENDTHCD
jgi:hypothetical protein